MTIVRAPIGSLLKNPKPAKAKRQTARAHDDGHLDFIRKLPCVITGTRPVEAAHIRFASKAHGKPITGLGIKPDDKWTVPLCPEKHREQHSGGEVQFWARHGIDPLVVALRLWEVSGDVMAGERIIRETMEAAS